MFIRLAALCACLLLLSGLLLAQGNIQQRIDNARPGQTVALPAGVYTTGNLTLKDGVSLKGDGYSRTIIDAAGMEFGVQINGTRRMSVSDLTIINAVQSGMVVHSANRLNLERVTIRNCGGALAVNNATDSTMQNLLLVDCNSGVSISNSRGSALINTTIANIQGAGLRISHCTKTAAFNNLIINVPYGISLSDDNEALTVDHNIYVANFVGEQQGHFVRRKVESWHALTGHDKHSQTIGVDFQDAANGDYRPVSPLSWAPVRATSSDWGAARLAGFRAPATDMDGSRRTGGIDLGAYEVSFPAPRPADGRFTESSGAGITSAGIFTTDGILVRYLFQNTPLAKGTYEYWLPTRDWQGRPIAANNYQLRVTEADLSLAYIAAAGNGDLAMSMRAPGGVANRASLEPHAVAFAADGRVLVAQSGFESREFMRSYDAEMNQIVWSFPGIGHTVGFAVDKKGRALAIRSDGMLMRLNGATGKGAPFADGMISKVMSEVLTAPSGMTIAGENVYIADVAANKLIRLSGDELNTTGSLTVTAPTQPAYDAKTGLIWVISAGKEIIAITEAGEVKAQLALVGKPGLLAANNGRLAVYDRQHNKITVYNSANPAELNILSTIGTGGEGYGVIRGDRFWDPKYLAMHDDGKIAVIDGPRTILLAADGAVLRQHMGMWGQHMSYGQFAGDDRMHFFNVGAKWSIIIDAKNRRWEPGVYWHIPASAGTPNFFFNAGGKNLGLFHVNDRNNPSFSIVHMDIESGEGRLLLRYSWDAEGLYLQRDLNGDNLIDEGDAKEPVNGPGGTRVTERLIDRGFANIDFRPDGSIVHPARNGLRIIPFAGFDANGFPRYDFANMRILRYTVEQGRPNYISPYDFTTPESINVAEDAFLMPDGSFNAVVTTKSGPGPDMATEHANGTSMAGFDAEGRMRWLWPLNPFGLKMGFYGITTIGGVTLAGRGAICEYESMDADGLGTGILGLAPEFGWSGMWLDNHRQTIGFTGNDGKPYLITGDYAQQAYHWQELKGWDAIVRHTLPLTVTPALADQLALQEAKPVAIWPVPAAPRVTIKKLDNALTMDGDPAKWRTLGIQPLVAISGNPASSSAVIRMGYDAEHYYVQVIKFDDLVTFHQTNLIAHYMQDGIEFNLNGYLEGWKYNVTRFRDGRNIVLRDRRGSRSLLDEAIAPRVIEVYDNAELFEERKLIEAATGLDMSNSKVVYIEFKLSKEALAGLPDNRQLPLESGKKFIFGFFINDNDSPGADITSPLMWPVTYSPFERDDRYATGVLE